MALRYTHATDESKRPAVENLVKPIGPSDESVTNEKAGSPPCRKSLILMVEQRGSNLAPHCERGSALFIN